MAKKKTGKPARRFVVGYERISNTTVYGQLHFLPYDYKKYDIRDMCEKMTASQAQRAVKTFPQPGATIYELVPVELKAKGGGA